MQYIRPLESLLFNLTIFSITIQLGKHFWPSYSFVEGIRIDYLSPTLFVSDLLIFSLIFLTLLLRPMKLLSWLTKKPVLFIFLFSILISSLFAKNQEVAFIANLKILEMIFLGWYISTIVFSKNKLNRMFDVLLFGAIIQSFITILQFILQKSINGPFYFLGERFFNASSIGISTFFTNGQELVRPYGTFPHPNVLAFYLSVVIILGTAFVLRSKINLKSSFYVASLMIIGIALLLTASRLIIITTLLASLPFFIKRKKTLLILSPLMLFVSVLYSLIFSGRFLPSSLIEAVVIRIDMINISLKIFFDNFLIGVGANNLFFYQNYLSSLPTPYRFQPVHNVYLFILVEFGIFGGIVVFWFIFKTLKRALQLLNVLIKRQYKPLFNFSLIMILSGMVFVGFFDHFPVTLQQGQLMTALILGMIWNKSILKFPQEE